MADASGHDKEMENLVRAEIAVAGVKKREPQCIDDAAYGVEESAGQQPGKGRVAQGVNELTKYGEAGPSHRDIYNRRNIFRTGHPAELEEHTGCCDTPYSDEKRISGIRCEHEQAYRRVGACNQDEDHHMIKLFKELQLRSGQIHRMIERARSIEQDHARHKDGHRCNSRTGGKKCCFHKHRNGCKGSEQQADQMCDGTAGFTDCNSHENPSL